MTKARTLADFISDGSPLADGTISVSEVSGAAPLANPTFTGTASGTFSGPLTGAVTGNVTGDLTGNVAGNVTGNVTGDLTGNVTAPFVSLVGTLPTLDFGGMLLQVAVGQATDPVAVGTWFDSTASDGYKYGDLDKSGSIGAQDGLLMNQLSAGLASEAVTSRWYNIIVPSLVTQSWYADLVTDGTILAGGTLDITNGWTIEQEAGNFHVSKDNVTKLDIASDGALTTNSIDLSAIAATIADTAVDIFVYDTRKDSDGGAWRKRTQGTSWYNETLNTATRGSRKEFPAVAVIVAESSQVTIYDGDDPDLPMWAVLDANTTLTSVFARNGLVCPTSASAGVVCWNFVSETLLRYISTGKQSHIWTRDVTGSNFVTVDATAGIVSNVVNDVAMTVLPNAPIDAATGLPMPTIAVATAGGTSVIRDDGTVVDVMAGTNAYGVEFTKDHKLLHTANDANSTFSIHVRSIPSSDTTALASRRYNHDGGGGFTTPPISGISNESTSNKLAILPNHTIASATFGSSTTGGKPALNLLQEVASAPTKGMVAYTTSSYNTGWMNGDIKLATLSDTDATNVTGSELVTNGTFDTDTSGWTASNATLSVVSSTLKVADNGSNSTAYQAITTTVGSTYTVSLDVVEISGAVARVLVHGSAPTAGYTGTYLLDTSSTGSYGLTFTATASTTYLQLCSESTHYVRYDNISVRLAEEDRSVNGNGLQVFGTVTKSAVATGADLVGYSGFTPSNYLSQPINAMGIDWSTEWSLMFWSLDQGFCVSLEKQNTSNYNNTVLLLFNDASNFVTRSHNANYNVALSGGLIGLHHIAAVYKDGRIIIYQDGVSIYDNTSNGISNKDVGLMVGARTYNGSLPYAPADQKLALLRVSGTNPSPEQIKKIYEDEKVLFQENAQATLYGSSDAVTALAYDDTTELLHVGTSAGRSVFQGLRRVDNTTTAVGAAISASNGLVAED